MFGAGTKKGMIPKAETLESAVFGLVLQLQHICRQLLWSLHIAEAKSSGDSSPSMESGYRITRGCGNA